MKILYITDFDHIPCEIAINNHLTVVYGEGYHEYTYDGRLKQDDRSIVMICSKFKHKGIELPEIIRVRELKEMTVDVVFKDLTSDSTLWRCSDFDKVSFNYGTYRVVRDEYTKDKLIKVFGETYAKQLVMYNHVVDLIDEIASRKTI